jgi:SAM-dependent methyltransferase
MSRPNPGTISNSNPAWRRLHYLVRSVPGLRIAPAAEFHTAEYSRHNQRRLEHLASLGLPIAGRSVLEVGAGLGDHTSFFLDRGCRVVVTDGRARHVAALRARFPQLKAAVLDLDKPDAAFGEAAEVVCCYGTLYHLARPQEALQFLSHCCTAMLLLETCVSGAGGDAINPICERAHSPSQSVSGQGCRPTRGWIRKELKRNFKYVYLPLTQPWHEEFPLDWTSQPADARLTRAVFIASREPITNPLLCETIPSRQIRH